jgi:type II secretory pathway predicted ATPase ExeA
MYLKHFGFIREPFQRDIPPECLYVTEELRELDDRLRHVVENRQFLVLTGDSGCGKTTATRRFMASLNQASTVALYISDSALTPRNFYFAALDQLGVKAHFYRGDAKRQLVKEVTRLNDIERKQVVILIDEAHLFDMEMFTEIRFLLNFDMDSRSPMSLILVAQTEIRDVLKKQVYEAISQRVDLRCHIAPLDRPQSADYIAAHLEYALPRGKNSIFIDTAIDKIFSYSGGIPRRINRIAVLCLMHAAQVDKQYVDEHMVSLIRDTELSW